MARILVIDNYDSFVYNIVSYLAQLGAEVEVWRNDDSRFEHPGWHEPFDGVLLSPGPGTPEEAGVCVDVIQQLGGQIPIFGVCLGLQAMAVATGGVVGRAPQILHGKTSPVTHGAKGCFSGLASPVTVTRYHSLAVHELSDDMVVTARSDDGTVMGIRHREWPMEAVQFHPESICTHGGYLMLANWLAECGDDDAPTRAAGMTPLTDVVVEV